MPKDSSPLSPGKVCRVRFSFTSYPFEFSAGQLLRFVKAGYERYDGVTIFHFENLDGTKKFQFLLNDGEPRDKLLRRFEEVDAG